MTPARFRRVPTWSQAALATGFVAAVTPYLIALGSPLQLFGGDPITYLALADRLPITGNPQGYPPGYPALLRFAEDVGLGSAWGFVAVNLILLAVAVGCIYCLCRQPMGLAPVEAALVCMAVLLAHIVSELTPVVMSDIAYFGVAMFCLLVLSTAEPRWGRPRGRLLILAGALAAIAISIRIAGLALLPPIVYVAAEPYLIKLWRVVRRRPATVLATAAVSLLVLVAVTVVVTRTTPYGDQVTHTWSTNAGPGAVLSRLGADARDNLSSLGGIALQTNCCQRVAAALGVDDPGIISYAFAVVGLALVALVVLGWRARRRLGAIEVFVLATAAVNLVYAVGTPRYWLPALPFIIAYALLGLERFARLKRARVAVLAYVAAFAVAGAGWLIDSVRISTSGREFPRVAAAYLDPRLAASYRVAFGDPQSGDRLQASPLAVELLRRYEPLARDGKR